MNVKLLTVKLAEKSIIKLASNEKLPQKYLYRLKFLMRTVAEIEESRTALVKKYGQTNVMIYPDDPKPERDRKYEIIEKLNNEFDDLLNEEVEVKFIPIPVKEIQAVAGLNGVDYDVLECFLEGEPGD